MGILWTIIIGFVAGIIAKFIMPGDNEPAGFIMTTILGIVGAFVATFLGQSLGWYRPGEGAGLIGAVVGAIIVLLVYGMIAGRRRTVETTRADRPRQQSAGGRRGGRTDQLSAHRLGAPHIRPGHLNPANSCAALSMLPLSVSGAIKMVLVSEAWSSLLLCSQRRFG